MGIVVKAPKRYNVRNPDRKREKTHIKGYGTVDRRKAIGKLERLVHDLKHHGPSNSLIYRSKRETLLSAALAHARGKLHFRRISHETFVDYSKAAQQVHIWDLPKDKLQALMYQERVIRNLLLEDERRRNFTIDWVKQRGKVNGPGFALGEYEQELIEFILDSSFYKDFDWIPNLEY